MVSILKDDGQSAYGIRHFVADVEKDIPTIGTSSLSAGSTIFVIDTSNTYMLNSSKLWIKIKVSSGGGGGVTPGGEEYDGGSIDSGSNPEQDGGIVKRMRRGK